MKPVRSSSGKGFQNLCFLAAGSSTQRELEADPQTLAFLYEPLARAAGAFWVQHRKDRCAGLFFVEPAPAFTERRNPTLLVVSSFVFFYLVAQFLAENLHKTSRFSANVPEKPSKLSKCPLLAFRPVGAGVGIVFGIRCASIRQLNTSDMHFPVIFRTNHRLGWQGRHCSSEQRYASTIKWPGNRPSPFGVCTFYQPGVSTCSRSYRRDAG